MTPTDQPPLPGDFGLAYLALTVAFAGVVFGAWRAGRARRGVGIAIYLGGAATLLLLRSVLAWSPALEAVMAVYAVTLVLAATFMWRRR